MPFVGDDALVVEQVGESDWELRRTLRYEGRDECFVVPEGSRTDFASVPRPLVWLIPRYGRYTRAAVLHDFLWRTGATSKADADGIFRRALRELGTSVARRWLMWAAVRTASTFGDLGAAGRHPATLLKLLAVVIPGVVFVAVPFTVVSAWLVLFYVVDSVVFVLAWAVNHLKHVDDRRQPNAPDLAWKLS
jgi:hypothetical protein